MPKFIFAIFFSLLFVQYAFAQDANYWSSSYNPGGFFTPGAVIAFNRDSGVMFLNPALLAYSNKNTASFNGSLYQYRNINIKNAVGTGLDLDSKTGSIVPLMASASISIKGKHPFTIGYALIHNPVMSFQVTQQRDARFNVLNDSYSSGDESFLGQFRYQNNINETEGVISGGVKLSDRFAIGLSASAQLRKQNYSVDVTSKALYNDNSTTALPPFANVEETYLAGYYNVGIRLKGGLAYSYDNHHWGFTFALPFIKVMGKGNVLSNDQINDLKIPGAGADINLLANSRQQNLRETYKMPLSIGLGYTYDYKKGQVYFATEYFAKINEYNILTPRSQSFIKGDVGAGDLSAPQFLRFKDARKSVINFGIGASYRLDPEVIGFLALHTNFSYANDYLYNDTDGYKANTANYNIYHCQIGANFKKRNFNFRAGLLLSYGGTNSYKQYINFDNPNESNFLNGNPGFTKASQFNAGLMLAYIHNL